MGEETGHVTGTKDRDYDLLWFAEACLSNALRLETYAADAESAGDGEVAELFRKAQADSRKGAETAKRLLAARLTGGAGGGSGDEHDGDEHDGDGAAGTTTEGADEGTATVLREDPEVGDGAPGPAGEPGALPQDPTKP